MELAPDRLDALGAEALDLARRCGNVAELHFSRGETREGTYLQQAEANIQRYARILGERARAARAAAQEAARP